MVEFFSPAILPRGTEVAQLHRLWVSSEFLTGLDELFGSLQLAFGVDDLGTAQALSFGLLGDGADHLLVEVDVFQFDVWRP